MVRLGNDVSILTDKAPFGDNLTLLTQYTMAQAKSSRSALLEAGISSSVLAFIEHCMAPKPSYQTQQNMSCTR